MKKGNCNQVEYSEDGKTLLKVSKNYKGELIIPEGVTEIGECAFWKCEKLTNVVFPPGLTRVNVWAFYKCCSITEIEIPSTVKYIGNCAFNDCENLKKVILHDGIEEIDNEAFSHCAITDIVIPKSVISFGELPFMGCPLENITVEGGNPVYDSRENCNAIIETQTNTLIISSKNTKIPESVTAIGGDAFYVNEIIESIYIPKNVVSIGEQAFTCCTKLSAIKVDKENPIFDSRENCNAIIETAANKLIAGCGKTIIPNSVKSIGEYVFNYCQSLTNIYIPDSVEDIGKYAFSCCRHLETIRLPQNLKKLNSGVFAECILDDIDLPDSLEYIGFAAFKYCNNLTKIDIPQYVKEIRHNSFKGQFQSIKVHPQNTVYDSREDCNAIIETKTDTLIRGCLTTIIPSSVKHIGDEAFYKCEGLKEITIPEGVISIGEEVFEECDDLTRIILPSTLQSVGDNAFDCLNLKEIIIPSGHKDRYSKMVNLKKFKKLFIEQTNQLSKI